jgi:hypothetical protein
MAGSDGVAGQTFLAFLPGNCRAAGEVNQNAGVFRANRRSHKTVVRLSERTILQMHDLVVLMYILDWKVTADGSPD